MSEKLDKLRQERDKVERHFRKAQVYIPQD